MNTVVRTAVFDRWLSGLRDARGKARIIMRIRTVERGHFGDCKPVGGSVYEMRIHYGPGYRLYFSRKREKVFVLLCGGAKNRQKRDILRARVLARKLKLD